MQTQVQQNPEVLPGKIEDLLNHQRRIDNKITLSIASSPDYMVFITMPFLNRFLINLEGNGASVDQRVIVLLSAGGFVSGFAHGQN